jgi:hypothetical protein
MKCFLLLVYAFLISFQAVGQATSAQAKKQNNNALKYSFAYFGHYKLSPKWGIHTDVQFRMDEKLNSAFQSVYRLGLIRYLKPDLGVIAGYAQLHTHAEAFEDYYLEHRIWQQLYYLQRKKWHSLMYRFRLEQRFVEKLKLTDDGEVVTDHYSYGNRLRFYNRTIFDLTKNLEAENVLYLVVQDEVFLGINAPEINRHIFDQNRFVCGIGVYKNKHTRLEIDYINFFLNPSEGENIMVHTLGFAVIQNMDFGKNE